MISISYQTLTLLTLPKNPTICDDDVMSSKMWSASNNHGDVVVVTALVAHNMFWFSKLLQVLWPMGQTHSKKVQHSTSGSAHYTKPADIVLTDSFFTSSVIYV